MTLMSHIWVQNRSALVTYATETGNAYDFAEELGRLLKRIHFRTRVTKLDVVDANYLKEYTAVLIVVSTTGQGDLPANGKSFWRGLLRKKLPPTYLQSVQFSIFGLGDSSYPKFNWAARKLHKRLLQLGANELYPYGEADEQHDEGLDATFVPWSSGLRNYLLATYPLPEGVHPIPGTELLEPEWTLALQPDLYNRIQKPITNGHAEAALNEDTVYSDHSPGLADPMCRGVSSQKLAVILQENYRMTPPDHWQDVRHLVLTSGMRADYGPGDVLTIFPKNMQDDVDQLLARMDWADVADKPITFTRTSNKDGNYVDPLPPCSVPRSTFTLRALLTECIDITAIPRRSFFSLMAHFTDNQSHKDRLLEFTKPEYIDELHDYTTRPRRSIIEVLQEFDSVRIPWQWAATALPELRGRQFSIASGGKLKQTSAGGAQFELLVAIVKYKTVIKKLREGVCTRYLATLPTGTELNVALQKGSLAIRPDEVWRPVVMVGPGTGVAPMRSLIWERRLWASDMKTNTGMDPAKQNSEIGENVLFFGCRGKRTDYFYHEEWDNLNHEMPLKVHPAFSQDQKSKMYVQDLIRQQSKAVYRVLHEADGLVYVCGSSGKMPQAVRAALADVFMQEGDMDQATARKYLEDMEREGRYKQETW